VYVLPYYGIHHAAVTSEGTAMSSYRIDNTRNVINQNVTTPLAPLDPLTGQPANNASTQVGTTKPTLNLFDTSSYQTTPQTVTLQDGSTITLPSMSEDETAQMQTLFANVPADKQQAVNAAGQAFAEAIRQHVATLQGTAATDDTGSTGAAAVAAPAAGTVARVAVPQVQKHILATSGTDLVGPSSQASAPVAAPSGSNGYSVSQSSPDVLNAFNSAAKTYSTATGSSSGYGNGYDNTVQAVAYMGVQGLQTELGQYAQTMQGSVNQQNTIRVDQSELSQAVADWPAGTDTQTFTFHNVDSNGMLQTYTQSLTQSQTKSMADTLSNTLATLSDQTQLQQMNLQNMSQNYQQGVTTISNLIRMQYDMVKNTIGNIHY
jgi:hypothetical protein